MKTIIIDCPIYQGNSGGPIIELYGTVFDSRYGLIGLGVEFIPYAEVWEQSRYKVKHIEIVNSGFSVVEPIEKVGDIICII